MHRLIQDGKNVSDPVLRKINCTIFPVPGRLQSPRRTFQLIPSAVRPQSWYQHTWKDTSGKRKMKCIEIVMDYLLLVRLVN